VRKVAYLALAILVLAGGGMLAVYLLSLPDPAPADALPPPAVDSPPPPDAPLPAAPDLSRFQGGKAPPAPMVYAPKPTPPPDSWEAIPLTRERSLGRVGAALRAGLEPLGPQLGACLGAAGGGAGSAAVSAAAGDEDLGGEGGGGPAVVLHVESLPGQLRIVDAPVLAWQGTSEAAMACVQQALRGRTMAAPAARPGQKLRVAYPLQR